MKFEYKFHFLGTVTVERASVVETGFRSRKAAALLGYLTSQPGPVPRQTLATLFWPEHNDSRGRRNLSRELVHLNQLFPHSLVTNRHTIQFRPEAACWVDIAQFTRLVAQYQPPEGNAPLTKHIGSPDEGSLLLQVQVSPFLANLNPASLVEAVALYRGDFMSGVLLDGCDEFENWLRHEREVWQKCVIQVLEQLFAHYALHREDERAMFYLRRWLEVTPWDERAHQYLMLLLMRNGDRAAALVQYETCRRELAEHLDTPSSHITEALRAFVQNHQSANFQNWLTIQPAQAAEVGPVCRPSCPYPGLAAFTEEDAPLFFGREVFVGQLLARVRQQPLLAVVGPSGSGKSSLVQAGLLPKLRSLPGQIIATLRPGSHPFQALAQALHPQLLPPATAVHVLADQLLAQTLTLKQLAGRLAGRRLLLVVDQFEELFTLCEAEDTRQKFMQMLLAGLASNTGGVQVILTLRADFMEQALSYRPMADALQPGLLLLGPMSAEELERAIEQPARRQSVQFEAGLVARLQQDVGHEPGRLPLLQFTLTALWEQARTEQWRLTHRAYEAVGGVVGALSGYAERIYDSLSPVEQFQMQQIFVQLVQPGTRAPDTRRVALRAELGEENWVLVQKLINSRLVVTSRDAEGRETVEVAHEALIRAWPRWQQWLARERDFRNWQERLRLLAKQWEVTKRDQGALLRGALLDEAERWFQIRASALSQTERAFITHSLEQRDRALQAEQAQREREARKLTRWWQRIVEMQEAEAKYQHEIALLKAQLQSSNPNR